MKLGLIGVGVVGGTLYKWFTENTDFEIARHDPPKGLNENLKGSKAIFISIPVPAIMTGQYQEDLKEAVIFARQYTKHVFIRSTVLPGTNDRLGTYSMPEYLTARRAYQDFCALPLLFGQAPTELIKEIFEKKIQADGKFYQVSNVEAELAKYTHNIFGALKVSYFNMIYKLSDHVGANFENVKTAANITGFLGEEHLQVPGPDGKLGYGGVCYPTNMASFVEFLDYESIGYNHKFKEEVAVFKNIIDFNKKVRASL